MTRFTGADFRPLLDRLADIEKKKPALNEGAINEGVFSRFRDWMRKKPVSTEPEVGQSPAQRIAPTRQAPAGVSYDHFPAPKPTDPGPMRVNTALEQQVYRLIRNADHLQSLGGDHDTDRYARESYQELLPYLTKLKQNRDPRSQKLVAAIHDCIDDNRLASPYQTRKKFG